MERVKIRSHVETDGVLQIVMPTQLQNTEVEVTVVVQPVESESENYDLSSQKEPPKNIQQISEEFRQLRQSIPSDNLSIREMIEEGRRF
jgi:hypothetical protein